MSAKQNVEENGVTENGNVSNGNTEEAAKEVNKDL